MKKESLLAALWLLGVAAPSSWAQANVEAEKLARAQAHEQAGKIDQAAEIYLRLLEDAKTSEGSNSKARLALVRAWLPQAEKAATPCMPPPKKDSREGVMVPPSVEARNGARDHLACLKQRGVEAAEVAALEKRLDALLAKDETSCKEQGRTTFGTGGAGLLGILGTKKDAGPCRPPSPFTGDAVAKSLGVKAPEADFGSLLGKPPAKSKSR